MSGAAIPPRMRAAVWRGPGEPLAAELVPTPRVEAGEDVVVRVRAANFGAALVRACTVGHPRLTPPAVLGSLVAGDVVEVGGDVRDLAVGAAVAVDPHPPCGRCDNCRMRVPALCLAKPRLDPGGLAEYVRVSGHLTSHLRAIPAGVSYAAAAYTEIVACVAESVAAGGVGPGDTVVIVGCGPTGLLHVQLARLAGAARVICLVNHPERETAVIAAGGVPVDVTAGSVEERVRSLADGRGADVAFEAVGRAETYALALRLVRPGGTVVGFGGCPPGTRLTIDPNHLHYDAIRFVGSYHYAPGRFGRALGLLAAGSVDLGGVLTHTLPLGRIAEAPSIAGAPRCVALMVEP